MADLDWVCVLVEEDGCMAVEEEERMGLEEEEVADEVARDDGGAVCEGFCCSAASFRSMASIFASVLPWHEIPVCIEAFFKMFTLHLPSFGSVTR